MSNVASSARAKCPYFKRDKGNAIVCEGAVEGSKLLMLFDKTEQRIAWQRRRCECFDYAKRCPVAGMLERKYAGDGLDVRDGTA